MKKWMVILAVVVIWFGWSRNERVVRDPPNIQPGEVVMFSTESCGYCKLARRLLDEHQVPYTELDVEKSEEARQTLVRLTGRQGVPVLVVKGTLIQGYNKGAIVETLYRN